MGGGRLHIFFIIIFIIIFHNTFMCTHAHVSLEKELAITPVLSPGESHGQRSLAGYSSWGHKESDTTERLTLYTFI